MDVFVQCGGVRKLRLFKLESDLTVAALRRQMAGDIEGLAQCQIFMEGDDSPLGDEHAIDSTGGVAYVHVNRCRRVEVTVRFSGHKVKRDFSPAQTLAHVRRWAVVKGFGLGRDQVGDYLLLDAGTGERADPDAHVGAFASPCCSMTFDLAPTDRINGHRDAPS